MRRGWSAASTRRTPSAIVGSLAASLLLVAWIGCSTAGIDGAVDAGGVLMLAALADLPAAGRRASILLSSGSDRRFGVADFRRAPDSGVLVAYGRNSASWAGHTGDIPVRRRGAERVGGVSRLPTGARVSQRGQTRRRVSRKTWLQRLGYLTTLVSARPALVLVTAAVGNNCGIRESRRQGKYAKRSSDQGFVPNVVSAFQRAELPRRSESQSAHRGRWTALPADDGRTLRRVTADPFDLW